MSRLKIIDLSPAEQAERFAQEAEAQRLEAAKEAHRRERMSNARYRADGSRTAKFKAELEAKVALREELARLTTGLRARGKGVTVAAEVRALVAAGKTDGEVWEVIKVKFKLDDSKRYYPAWYRRQAARKAAKEAA